MKTICLLLLWGNTLLSLAQNELTEVSLRVYGLAGNRDELPFWLIHNQLGRFSPEASWQELTEFSLSGNYQLNENLNLNYGTQLALSIQPKELDPKIIQAWAGLSGHILSFKAGAFAEDLQLGGLSSTNGDITRSLNYRPYPKMRLSTSGFIPLFFAKSWFRVKAEYDEGILYDERYVEKPHLHHRSYAIRFLTSHDSRLTLGINHYVFWGGTLPDGEQLPTGLRNYFRYIFGQNGNDQFLETDQINVAGNHLGSYLVTFEKNLENHLLEFRFNHPYEDHSGMEFDNLRDNIYTIYLKKKKTGTLIDELLLEYMYTKHQSGDRHQITGPKEERMRGMDNYFNHGVYHTGFSHMGFSMGTPLFYPLTITNEGVQDGFENNRVSVFHLGAKGFLIGRSLAWKSMLTYSRNFGTWKNPYDDMKQQFFSLCELSLTGKNRPYTLSAQLAADFGELRKNSVGFGLHLKRTFH
ncbi:capsule assembly Wzi family protein [Gaoshiqia sp. Z1-71]|uniref:capsule assembly Wzi family protein n=1 Tax=Gaoshiqia hydrogeniformans TaxID=3290090 RepID=UPI003BF88BBE